jgi:poly-gamma-glutamate synthesis protein (capsule biosynthesis protein)
VAQDRREVDALVVSPHWGGNWGRQPPPEHERFGDALVDAGADVMFGHSCHIVRGVATRAAAVFFVDLETHRARRVEIEPTVIRDLSAWRSTGDERRDARDTLARRCAELGTRAETDATTGRLMIGVGRGERPWPVGPG